jgi:hypothetical protein
MAKKYKRSVSAGGQSRSAGSSATTTTPTTASSGFSRRGSADDFNPDYGYIIRDLKRIGILAGSFFGLLVIISFFINK